MKNLLLLLLLPLALGGGLLPAQETASPEPQQIATPTPQATVTPSPEPIVSPSPEASPTPELSAEERFEAKIESAVESFFESSASGGTSPSGKKGVSIKIGGDKKGSDQQNHGGISIQVDDEEGNKIVKKYSIAELLPEIIVPTVAIIMVFGGPIALVGIILLYRMKKNRLLHQTIQNIVASGQPIPPELLASSGAKALPTAGSDRRRGIILAVVGLGIIAYQISNGDSWGIGLIPLMIGAGYLLTSHFAPRGGNNDGPKN